ncbi:hypothetical protein TNCV_2865421 [Trichonephila clavipes]|nr:hypothetical protein TNCV_2865421 [Trichonephila clavipes]
MLAEWSWLRSRGRLHFCRDIVQSSSDSMMWMSGVGMLAQVSSLDRGSKLRVPLPVALVLPYSVTLINMHSPGATTDLWSIN